MYSSSGSSVAVVVVVVVASVVVVILVVAAAVVVDIIIIIISPYVECENNGDTSNNWSDWHHLGNTWATYREAMQFGNYRKQPY